MRNPNPRVFNLDASLLQCDLLLSFSLVKSLVALGGKKGVGWLFGRRQTGLGRRGNSIFIVPLIPDTSGIRGLAQIIPKYVLTLPIPFSVVAQSKKVYDLDPNRVLSLFLSNAINLFSLSK